MTRSLRVDCHLFCIYAGNSQSIFLTVRLNDDSTLYNTGERYIYETSDN